MTSCEFLIGHKIAASGQDILRAMREDCPMRFRATTRYEGNSDLLMVWGAGGAENAAAISRHHARGGRSICWDYGYFRRSKRGGYLRVSVDDWHPQRWIDSTPPNASRWAANGVSLRDDADPDGPIILVGMGPKSHKFIHDWNWEKRKLAELQAMFPGRQIIYRPKPGRSHSPLPCKTSAEGSIQQLLVGASLVVCRHSNVAVDAVVAGVPFDCEDGAAQWLSKKPFTPANRLDFLQRLSCWQWHHSEAVDAWQFLLGIINAHSQPV